MTFQIRRVLKYVAVALIVFLTFEFKYNWRLISDVYWSIVGLEGDSTAYDYLSASTDKRVRFLGNMCDNGVCLHPVDWRCGFTIDSIQFQSENYADWHEAVEGCFSKLVKGVPVYTSLDKVRKICGRLHMQFDPASGVTEQECANAKGNWGVKMKLYPDEDELISKNQIAK